MTIIRLFSGAAVLAVLLVTTPPVRAQDESSMDHAAMARSYRAEAKEAEAKVSTHERMLERYKNAPTQPKGTAFPKEAMVQHCQKLVDSYKQAAVQATDLAKLHQQAADAGK